ncbi:MAG: choice-of-anchor Q domain-containing protein [Spirochaetota bacterium]
MICITLLSLSTCDVFLVLGGVDTLVPGNSFYVDPVNGSPDGDGSLENPWRTVEDVIDAGLIKAWRYDAPYNETRELEPINPDGPVTGGDTIYLMDGDHGELDLRQCYNLRPLTFEAYDDHEPVVSRIEIMSASHVVVRGLTVRPDPGYTEAYRLVYVHASGWHGPLEDVTIEDNFVYSVPDSSEWSRDDWNTLSCSGIGVRADHVNVIDNRLLNVNFGISYDGNFGVVRGNEIENFSGDGMRGIGSDLLFEYNTVRNCYAVNGNHDDGFQSWSIDDQPPRERVVLRGNVIIGYTDPEQPFRGTLQGIGCFDGFFHDWVVENNLIVTDHWHGITLSGARRSRIVNNTVVDLNDERPGPPWIRISAHKDGRPSEDCLIRNNIAATISAGAGVRDDHNYRIPSFEQIDAIFRDPAAGDYSLAEDSPARDAGISEEAAFFDILGRPRPRGAGIDLGAYETY